MLRGKLGAASHRELELIQIWGNKEVELSDDADFVAFAIRAKREGFATVRVLDRTASTSVPLGTDPQLTMQNDPASSNGENGDLGVGKPEKKKKVGKKETGAEKNKVPANPSKVLTTTTDRIEPPETDGNGKTTEVVVDQEPRKVTKAPRKRKAETLVNSNDVEDTTGGKKRKKVKKTEGSAPATSKGYNPLEKPDDANDDNTPVDPLEVQNDIACARSSVLPNSTSRAGKKTSGSMPEQSTLHSVILNSKVKRQARSRVPCPVCLGPFHALACCPIVERGPSAIESRITELRQELTDNHDNRDTIKELLSFLKQRSQMATSSTVENDGTVSKHSSSPSFASETNRYEDHRSLPPWATIGGSEVGNTSDASDQINESQYLLTAPLDSSKEDREVSLPRTFYSIARLLDLADSGKGEKDSSASDYDEEEEEEEVKGKKPTFRPKLLDGGDECSNDGLSELPDLQRELGSAKDEERPPTVLISLGQANDRGETASINSIGDEAFSDVFRHEDRPNTSRESRGMPSKHSASEPQIYSSTPIRQRNSQERSASRESSIAQLVATPAQRPEHLPSGLVPGLIGKCSPILTIEGTLTLQSPMRTRPRRQEREACDTVETDQQLEGSGATGDDKTEDRIDPGELPLIPVKSTQKVHDLAATSMPTLKKRRDSAQLAATQPAYPSLSSISILPSRPKSRAISSPPLPLMSPRESSEDESDDTDEEKQDERGVPISRQAGAGFAAFKNKTRRGLMSLWSSQHC